MSSSFSVSTLISAAGMLLFFLSSGISGAAPVFIPHVSETEGWYDVNKKTKWTDWPLAQPNWWEEPAPTRPKEWNTQPIDSLMCWAAAASNILQWWQDNRTDVAASTPNGYASTYAAMPQVAQLSIYQMITRNWTDGGGQVEQAWNWWFNGGMLPDVYYPTSSQIQTAPISPGGYWSHLGMTFDMDSIESPLFRSYGFYSVGNTSLKKEFTGVFTDYIDNGWGVSLSLTSPTTGHAITMWGYDYTEEGDLILYLTDSDDYRIAMFRQILKMSASGHLYLEGIDNETAQYAYDPATATGWEVTSIHALTAPLNLAPEPSVAALALAGCLAGMWRRRRRV